MSSDHNWEACHNPCTDDWFVLKRCHPENRVLADELTEAEARLMAAAPELLRAVQYGARALALLLEKPEMSTNRAFTYDCRMALRGAILRAEGRKP